MEGTFEPDPPASSDTRDDDDDGRKQLMMAENTIVDQSPFSFFCFQKLNKVVWEAKSWSVSLY